MTGIRQKLDVSCPQCGATGTLALGMSLVNARLEQREFACAGCKHPVAVEAPRAIVDLMWNPAPTATTAVHAAK